MSKKIIFRADGNSDTGLGHLFRLFAIVEIIRDHYDYVYFLKPDSTVSVVPEDYNYKFLPEYLNLNEEANWFSKFYDPKETIVIADGYQFNSAYQKHIKENGFKLIYVDDLAWEYMYADIVINHSPHISKNDFRSESYTKFALGPKYSILRPLFLEAAKQKRIIEKIDTAFVCFGGADAIDLTLKAVKALLDIPQFVTIHVVLGGAYKHKEIFELKDKFPKKIMIHQNLSEYRLVKVMQACNFAIAPASTILFELCCVKMPVLSGYYVENQEYIYKGFSDSIAIYEGGNMENYKEEDFIMQVKRILEDKSYDWQINAQYELFDKNIKTRHLNLISQLC